MNSPSAKPTAGTRSDRKRAAVMRAAVETFAECGFEQATMDAIAESAKVSKRTVYNHFFSKDTLFDAIVADLCERSRTAGEFRFCDETPPRTQLESFAWRVVEFHCEPATRRLAKVILPRLLECPDLAKELFGDAKLFQLELETWIDHAVRVRALDSLEVTIAARQFLGLLETFVVWPILIRNSPVPTRPQRRRVVEESVSMFLARYGIDGITCRVQPVATEPG